jgi:adenylyltransferase/sulfurtransferase
MEALKIITGIGQPLNGKLLLLDTLTYTQRIIGIQRNEEIIQAVKQGKTRAIETPDTCKPDFSYKQITSAELRQLLDTGTSLQLLDVREGNNRENIDYHNTLSIPFTHIAGYIDEISQEPMVVIYCQSGKTSVMAAEMLASDYGLTNIYNLKGGLNEWKKTED